MLLLGFARRNSASQSVMTSWCIHLRGTETNTGPQNHVALWRLLVFLLGLHGLDLHSTQKKKLMSALLYGSKEMYFGLYATLISWWCPNETQAMRNELWINLGHPRFFNMHLMFDTRVFAFCEHQSVTKNWPHGYQMAPMHQQQYAIATGPLWQLICLVQHPSFVSTIEKDA